MLDDDDLIVGTKSVIRPVWLWLFSGLCLVVIGSALAGFILFANKVGSPAIERSAMAQADGIIVMADGQQIVERSFDLLLHDKAGRLLVSGVGVCITKEGIRHIMGGEGTDAAVDRFNCCVDVDREAHDLEGHAEAARLWLTQHEFNRVILVTTAHQLPRTLLIFRAKMPETDFIGDPVAVGAVPAHEWWLHPRTTLFLGREFAKTLITWLDIQQRLILGD